MMLSFSEQAELLIEELGLDREAIKEWYVENGALNIGGGNIHLYLVDKVEGRFKPKDK
ncbi:MAG: hypothetical protein V3T43_06185 [Nitrosomonadaceae bacterium]